MSVWVVWASAAFWIVALSVQVGRWSWGRSQSTFRTISVILAAGIVPVLLTFKAADSVRQRIIEDGSNRAEEVKRHKEEEDFRADTKKELAEAKTASVLTILRGMTEPDGKVSPEVLIRSIGSDAERCVLDHFQLGWKLFLTDGTTLSREYKEVNGVHDNYTVDWSGTWARVTEDNAIDFVPPNLYLKRGPGKKPELAIGDNEVRSPPIDPGDKCKIAYGEPLERRGLYGGAAIVASDARGHLVVVGLGSMQPPVR